MQTWLGPRAVRRRGLSRHCQRSLDSRPNSRRREVLRRSHLHACGRAQPRSGVRVRRQFPSPSSWSSTAARVRDALALQPRHSQHLRHWHVDGFFDSEMRSSIYSAVRCCTGFCGTWFTTSRISNTSFVKGSCTCSRRFLDALVPSEPNSLPRRSTAHRRPAARCTKMPSMQTSPSWSSSTSRRRYRSCSNGSRVTFGWY